MAYTAGERAAGLRNAVNMNRGYRYVVLDGAQLDHPARFAAAYRLKTKPLFREFRDGQVLASSPLLALIEADDILEGLLHLFAEKPFGVIWSSLQEEGALYRHLRSINVIQVPFSAVEPTAPPSKQMTNVIFRHCDPRVLATVVPVFTPAQFARLLGPADGVAFCDTQTGAPMVIRNENLPEAKPGMVKVTSEQYAAIIGNRITASEHNIAAYLRETAPDGLAQVSDAQLLAFVRENTRAARELGIKTEKGLGRWCFLSMASGGKVNHNPAIRHAFANSGEPADSYLEKIMQQMLQAQGARRS